MAISWVLPSRTRVLAPVAGVQNFHRVNAIIVRLKPGFGGDEKEICDVQSGCILFN